jgi:di/tricarboxylate transporter
MQNLSGKSENQLVVVVMLISAGLSLFMNNIAAVGVLLPAVMNLSRHRQIAPSRLLLPLAYGTTLGGMATLLTTSNIIMGSALRSAGFEPFNLLDFLPIGGPIIIIGIGYMVFIGKRGLPTRYPTGQAVRKQVLHKELSSIYGIDKNLTQVEVMPGSRLANISLSQGQWARTLGTNVVGLTRKGKIQIGPRPDVIVQSGDILLVQGLPEPGLLSELGLRLSKTNPQVLHVADETVNLVEVVLSPHTPLIGKTLRELHFRDKYELNVLAIWRAGKPIQESLGDLRLEFGDALLVQGPAARIRLLKNERDLIVMEEDPDAVLKPGKARLSLLVTLLILGLSSTGVVAVAEVAMAGAVILLLLDCLNINDAYRAIEWKAIFLIAGMWPLSIAIRSSGLADNAISLLIDLAGRISPMGMAVLLMVVAFILTQFMGGQVASLVIAPLAITSAGLVGADPRALGMGAALACSLAFASPFGHPINVMVMGAGGYTTQDYLKIGIPLTILVFASILVGLRLFWGL